MMRKLGRRKTRDVAGRQGVAAIVMAFSLGLASHCNAQTAPSEPVAAAPAAMEAEPAAQAPVEKAAGAETSPAAAAEPSDAQAKPAVETVAPAAAPDPILIATRQRLATLSVAAAEREHLTALQAFYGARKEAPLWVGPEGFTARGKAVAAEIAKADDWGLEAAKLTVPQVASGAPVEDLAEAEARMGLAVLKYARHARGGRIDPGKLSKYIDVKPPLVEPPAVLDAIAKAEAGDAYLRSLHPKHPQFEKLRQALLALKAPAKDVPPVAAEAEIVKIPEGGLIRPGGSHPDVALLRKRLKVTADPGLETQYDAPLQTAVRAFQAENGLRADGVVGSGTRRALNGDVATATAKPSPGREAEAIALNMERWRWVPDELGDLYVWDNIPEYMMRVVKNGEKIHEEKIIVGKTNTPTPSFSARMQYVIFHPEWGVPDSIKVKELLPYLRPSNDFGSFFGGSSTDTRILKRHNLRVSYNGQPVDAGQIDWSQVDIRRYTFIQPSGGGNVLGVVKFRFPNKHDVYMHDTPQRELFKQSVRTFSHGCMRVHNPQRLAEVLLGEDQGISADQVRGLIASNAKTEITLKSQIPVHVTYMTAVVDDAGKVQHFNDIYGLDKRLSLALSGKQTEFYDPPTDGGAEASLNGPRPVRKRGNPQPAGPADFFAGLFGN